MGQKVGQASGTGHRVSNVDAAVTRLLREAALFRLLAQAFAYPGAAQRRVIGEALRRVGAVSAWRGRVRRALARAQAEWQAAAHDDLEGAYVRWFASDARCSLHETAYGDGCRIAGRAVELADIQAYHRAFGLQLSEINRDLPDHLCAELELYSLLLLKEAYARASRLDEAAQTTHAARRSFLERHLGRWVGALFAAMQEMAAPTTYVALGALATAAVEEQVQRLGVCPSTVQGRLPQDFMQGDTLVCPRAAATDAG
jgi:TorA maturation chaperone TorD